MTKCDKCENGLVKVGTGFNRCECQRDQIVKKLLKWGGIPAQYYKFKEDLKDQVVFNPKLAELGYFQIIDSITKDPAKLDQLIERQMKIILLGNPGSGKTQMATTITAEILRHFDLYEKELDTHRVYFLDTREIGNFMFEDELKAEVMRKVKKSDILIIDDLGAENYNTEAILNTMDELVRNFRGLTIITTNIIKSDKGLQVKGEKQKLYTNKKMKELKDLYDEKNSRLSDVLIPAREEGHGKLNVLYYYILTAEEESNRQINVEDLDLL